VFEFSNACFPLLHSRHVFTIVAGNFKRYGFGKSIGLTWRITVAEGGTKLAKAIWNSPLFRIPYHAGFSFIFPPVPPPNNRFENIAAF